MVKRIERKEEHVFWRELAAELDVSRWWFRQRLMLPDNHPQKLRGLYDHKGRLCIEVASVNRVLENRPVHGEWGETL